MTWPDTFIFIFLDVMLYSILTVINLIQISPADICVYIYIYIKTKISLQETLEKFNKKKSKKITVNDLQHEIRNIK